MAFTPMRAVSSTSNPVLSNNFWSNIPAYETMSYEGTMQKIGVLFGITILTALVTVSVGTSGNLGLMMMLTGIGGICGFITVLVMVFTRPKNPAPGAMMYALFRGYVCWRLLVCLRKRLLWNYPPSRSWHSLHHWRDVLPLVDKDHQGDTRFPSSDHQPHDGSSRTVCHLLPSLHVHDSRCPIPPLLWPDWNSCDLVHSGCCFIQSHP